MTLTPRPHLGKQFVRNRRVAAVAGLLALVVPLSGCGTRMSSEAISAADGSAISAQAANGAAGALTGDTGVIAPGAVDPSAAGLAAAPGTTGAATTGGATTGTTGAAAAAGPAAATGAKTNSGAKSAAAGAADVSGPNAPCKQTLAPVILGQTSPSSGIIGASTFNMRAGLALWARAVNAAGGVQCHPVQLYQMDDAADPARVTSNLNDMVNNKKAIAIVGAGIPTTFSAAKRFAEQNKVPFVGGDMIEAPWFSSQWFFPQGGGPLAAYAGATKEAALKANTKKVGLIYCVEAAICGTINENFEAMAKASNLEVVLRKVSSITSPDYTAECQALKAAGAEAVFVALEGSGDARFARSCLSLGYAPPSATSALSVSAEAALDPNFRKLGVYLGTGNAPYQANDNPGVKAFRAAYDRFAPGSSIDQNTISQWTSGKLFEKAIANVFEKARSGPITRDLLLEGLWMIKNEKLDGLAPGISFNKQAPPDQNDCYALLNLTTEGYTAPKGSKFECFKGLPKGF
ncbi:ABC transporter substrate-binding protein [Sporichthya polymorpha]|uniref:ABC transporter substrate-binding protein n=1 Tax=Sporichthya polymorpha TaxID=35751 RepID=UPI00037DF811|nr:ABC transporter substrate-binding protein [Sporichthya polymorpha]